MPSDSILPSNRTAAITPSRTTSTLWPLSTHQPRPINSSGQPQRVRPRRCCIREVEQQKRRLSSKDEGNWRRRTARSSVRERETRRMGLQERDQTIKLLESDSSELLFSHTQRFYQCRTDLEALWKGRTDGSLERILPVVQSCHAQGLFELQFNEKFKPTTPTLAKIQYYHRGAGAEREFPSNR